MRTSTHALLSLVVLLGASLGYSQEPQKPAITLSAASDVANVGQSLEIKWTANHAPGRLAFSYSANDGDSWVTWLQIDTGEAREGTVSLPLTWQHFNWIHFSYAKIKLLFTGAKDKRMLDRFLGNPVEVKAAGVRDKNGAQTPVLQLWAAGQDWIIPTYLGIFLISMLLYYLKTRWDELPRNNLSIVFNVICFGCLFAKLTFVLAFALYFVCGLMIWHYTDILKKQNVSKYGLCKLYQVIVCGVVILFAVAIVVGLVMRVRSLIFS